MKKEVVVCDCTTPVPHRTFGGIRSQRACRRLADGVCLICERDMCDAHLAFKLVTSVCNRVPELPVDPSSGNNAFPVTTREEAVRICPDCSMAFYDGGFDVTAHLDTARNAIIEEMRAHRAAFALRTEGTK